MAFSLVRHGVHLGHDMDGLVLGHFPVEALAPAELALSLSRLCRFAGHLSEHYSVAQHSIFVADCVENGLQLAALLHDAHESLIGDLPTPIKSLVGDQWAEICDEVDRQIARLYDFDVNDLYHEEIVKADAMAALAEYWTYQPKNAYWPHVPHCGIRVQALPQQQVAEEFETRLWSYLDRGGHCHAFGTDDGMLVPES